MNEEKLDDLGIKLHSLLSHPALHIFCLSGFFSVLVDIDHIPYALGLYPDGRPLHLLWGIVSLIGGCYGIGILGRKPQSSNSDSSSVLETFKAMVDDAFRDTPLNLRQNKAAAILPEAHKHLTRNEFKELENYILEKLEK